VGLFAQSAAELKNAGNAALKAKDYKTALENFEKFMGAPDTFEDAAVVFNSAYSAIKVKEYEKAVKYFDQSITAKYKLSSAYRFKAIALKKMNKVDEMVATLKAGIEACPTKNKKMLKTLGTHYLKEGVAAQKANKNDVAVAAFTKAAELKYKKNQVNAFLSLGTLYYNEGAKILQAATPIANSNPDKYKAEKGKAMNSFNKAIEYLNKAGELDPANEAVKGQIAAVKGAMK
jgi:tetratricopeptide (TPR) repeat protein